MTKEMTGSGRAGLTVLLMLAVGVALLSPLHLNAQTTYGSIVGTATDATGAVVPGATVTVTNLGTGEARTTTSDQSGNFSLVNLVPANYKVDVQKTGFKRFELQPVDVEVDATVRTNAALQVGTISETVEVTTQAALLQTDSGTLSTEISGTTVDAMPLNGRNTMNLIALAAGVVPQGSTSGGTGMNQGTTGHTNQAGWNNFQIGGSLAGESSLYVDGAPDTVLAGNQVGLVLTQDALQEFNVASNGMSADFGRNGGAVVNMATKSGTNSFHGSIYEYIRNRDFNANEYFNKLAELQQGKPNEPLEWTQNQYGAALGGPILKNKAFFHFTWEGFRAVTSSTQSEYVPTTNMQNGIIPETYQNGTLVNLVDTGANPAPPGIAFTPGTVGLSTCKITHQPGTAAAPGTWTVTNLWTPGCGDPMAKIQATYYPPPIPGYNLSGNNFIITPSTMNTQNQYNARGDYNLSSKQRLFVRYTYWTLADTGQSLVGDYNGWPTQNSFAENKAHQAIVGDTVTFSPTTVLDVRLSYLRDYAPGSLPQGANLSSSKFPGTYYPTVASQMTAHLLPNSSFTGSAYSIVGLNRAAFYTVDTYNTYSLTGNVIHIQGKHNLKVGVEARLEDDNNLQNPTSGSFAFTGNFTGDGWLDFLLGYQKGTTPGSGTLALANAVSDYTYYQGYYLTDTWQANRKLTFSYGLRYELPGGLYEKNDKATVLLPNQQWTSGTTSVTGELALVNSTLSPSRSIINVKHDLFAPRFGFAYRLEGDSAIRGSYSLSYLAIDTAHGGLAQGSKINNNSTTCGSTYNSGANWYPNFNQLMYNCFGPNNPLIAPTGRSPNFMQTLYGPFVTGPAFQSITGPIPTQSVPYTQQWNLSMSHQMKGDLMLELAYVGAKGTHMPALGNSRNQLADSYFAGQTVGSPLTKNALCAATGTSITVGQCNRPYPWYNGVTDSFAYKAGTSYNAMQLKAEKRFRSGGTIMANYTWSKLIGNTDSSVGGFLETNNGTGGIGGSGGGAIQDYNNPRAERSVLEYDVPQRAVVSYVLNLPFGKGQRWGRSAAGVADALISGWGINGITTFQKGYHLSLSDTAVTSATASNYNADLAKFGIGTLRPNYTAGCNKTVTGSAVSRLHGWFNTSCFSQPADFQFGNEPRVDTSLFSEGIDNFDFSILKSTKITERTNLQFRTEFFNTFNRVQFAPPSTSLGQLVGGISAFGNIYATANQPRLIQFSLRANF